MDVFFQIIRSLLKYWPRTSSQKEVIGQLLLCLFCCVEDWLFRCRKNL